MITVTQKPVPHFWKGHGTFKKPDCIVIHIAEGLRESVYQEFLKNQKSTHYLVNKDGSIWQFVDEENSAWGNGNVSGPKASLVLQRLNVNPNLYTISIEHEGFEKDGDISNVMYASSSGLVASIAQRWGIPLDNIHVIRHRDIYDKKSCPGLISVEEIIRRALIYTPATTEPPAPVAIPTNVAILQHLEAIKEHLAQVEKIIN